MTTDAPASVATAAALEVRDLDKTFGDSPVLRGVSLSVAVGEVLVLLGPSGCGKTTLLRTIAGLERPDGGEVLLQERPVAGPGTWTPPEARGIGMVFQDWALFPHLSVGRNVAYGLERSSSKNATADAVRAALALVDLAGFEDRMPETLSGGQQQRVALARALAPKPSVLLLDEPFSNLDTGLRVAVRGEVLGLLLDLGITAIFVTHDQEESFVLGDRVAVMFDGQIVQVGTPAELYQRPVSQEVAGFVGKAALTPGVADGMIVKCALGAVDLAESATGQVDVLVRPECVAMVDNGPSNARVELVEYYGHDAMVIARLADGSMMQIRAHADATVRRGDDITVRYVGSPTVAFPR